MARTTPPPAIVEGAPDEAAERTGSQGERTTARLLDAGVEVLAGTGFHAARVDDVVARAGVSHGTFYLYFANMEALVESLATRCADEMADLAAALPEVDGSEESRDRLRAWLADFLGLYRRNGAVIRAWAENQVNDRSLARLGRRSFGRIVGTLSDRLPADGGSTSVELRAAAMLGLMERFAYVVTSRDLGWSDERVLDTLAGVVHRGFFVAGTDR